MAESDGRLRVGDQILKVKGFIFSEAFLKLKIISFMIDSLSVMDL